MRNKAEFLKISVFVYKIFCNSRSINDLHKKSPIRSGMILSKFGALELEVNERAAVCAHELVNHEDDERRYSNHRRNR